jgi:hypothetical protein
MHEHTRTIIVLLCRLLADKRQKEQDNRTGGEGLDGRKELGFEKFVNEHFAFLVNEFGFVKTSSNPYEVQFDGSDRYVKVTHGRYELALVVGVANTSTEVSVNDLIEYESDTRESVTRWNWDASSRHSVELGVVHLSQLCYKVGKDALVGDVRYLEDVYNRSVELRHKAKRKHELNEIEQMASEAWTNHDYNLVITLYEPIKLELNQIQKQRLHLSKRKVSEGTSN